MVPNVYTFINVMCIHSHLLHRYWSCRRQPVSGLSSTNIWSTFEFFLPYNCLICKVWMLEFLTLPDYNRTTRYYAVSIILTHPLICITPLCLPPTTPLSIVRLNVSFKDPLGSLGRLSLKTFKKTLWSNCPVWPLEQVNRRYMTASRQQWGEEEFLCYNFQTENSGLVRVQGGDGTDTQRGICDLILTGGRRGLSGVWCLLFLFQL